MDYQKKTPLSLIFLFPIFLFAQTFSPNLDISDTSQVHILVSNRGDVFSGRVIEIIDTRVSFLAGGDIPIEFRFAEIDYIIVKGEETPGRSDIQGNYSGYRQPVDRTPETWDTQLMFLTSTAFQLEPGKKLYSNVDLLWNSLDFGVTENFSAGIGVFLPFMAIPRAKFSLGVTEKVHLALGTNIFTVYDFYELNMATHFFGAATFGKPELFVNITGGVIVPVGEIESRVMVTGFGGGGETPKFVYKAEFLVYQEPLFNGQNLIRLIPEIAMAVKSRNKRYEFGLVGIPVFDFALFPYLAFKSHF